MKMQKGTAHIIDYDGFLKEFLRSSAAQNCCSRAPESMSKKQAKTSYAENTNLILKALKNSVFQEA
jgi:hypothetical protein